MQSFPSACNTATQRLLAGESCHIALPSWIHKTTYLQTYWLRRMDLVGNDNQSSEMRHFPSGSKNLDIRYH